VIINKNEEVKIKSEEGFDEFIDGIFEAFECEIDEYYLDGGDYKFKIFKDGTIEVGQVWINIRNHKSSENYQNIIDMLDYIKEFTNIDFSIVDICVQ